MQRNHLYQWIELLMLDRNTWNYLTQYKSWSHNCSCFFLTVEFLYVQKTYRQWYHLSTLPRLLTPFTEERWNKFYSPMAYQKEIVTAIMMLYRNTKIKVRSLDGDTDYFHIVAGVLQGDTLAPYLFIICLDYMLRTSIDKIKESSFKLTKERSRRYLAKTITHTDYADDIVLLANVPAQAETLLHSLECAAAGIGLYVNARKMEYMCFNQTGDISTLNSSSMKLVDKFIYLGSSVSSTKTDIDTWLAKAWTSINRLSVMWKSDLTD